jgi:pimeloyl-ACP methyl ester carboxylesterase
MASAWLLHRASRLALPFVVGAISPLALALGQTAPGSPIISDVPVAGGTERVLFLGGQGARALLVLLPGGDGIIGLDNGGAGHQLGSNFLVRTIGQWVGQGFDVILPDAPNGTSLVGRRHLPAYAEAIGKVIDFGRSQAALPVWLIGTSQGSTAAVNGAAHLGSKVSGGILTSSVTRPGKAGETIFDAEPGVIAVPILVISNEYDTCAQTPPGDAPIVLLALTRAPRKELVMVTSSQIAKRADPCGGMSPHGYLAIETMVVQRISDWIRMVGAR